MKISARTIALLTIAVSSVDAAVSPTRISFESLILGDAVDSFRHALQEVGMVAITDIPSFASKMETMELLPRCMEQSSEETLEHTFSDGTRRLTLATHSKGTSASSAMPVADHELCEDFKKTSQAFRKIVGRVVEAFGDGLSSALGLDDSKPLLFDEANNGYSLNSIFADGEHLEHFHCYYDNQESTKEETIEWHTDQGLALAFTPGLVDGETTEGFFVQLSDGTTEMVDFNANDDLVFLLGDGVNQYVNFALDSKFSLRALPHTLHMPSTSSPRVWYGRMVLPPSKAIHPAHPMTFGEVRDGMMAEDATSSLIGCSHDLVARELSDVTCEEGTASYCWHRCMNYTDYDASPTICTEQSLDLACVNDEGDLWSGDNNPAFFIGCIDLDLLNSTNVTVTDDSDAHSDDGDKHGDKDMDMEMEDSAPSVAFAYSTLMFGVTYALLAL